MANTSSPYYTNDSTSPNVSKGYEDEDTLKNGEPLSADSAEMSILQPFMFDKDEDSNKKNSNNSLDQYDFDLGNQNMALDPSGIGEVVAENPELLAAL